MERKIIHVIGTGTIGEPLIGLLCDYREQLGIDEITFHKNSISQLDKTKISDLIRRGARLSVNSEHEKQFKKLKFDPDFDSEEAIKRSSVVIDCTPQIEGGINKIDIYSNYIDSVRGFIVQGNHPDFGKKYALGINDKTLESTDNFLQIASCNTHNIASITKTISLNPNPDNLISGRYVVIKRANDISQLSGFIPSPQILKHSDSGFGTYHAKDTAELFSTLGYELDLFSSSMNVNSQYMHVLWFTIKVEEPTTLDKVKEKLIQNPYIAMTKKDMTSTVFSFCRDHGHYGRIMNQTIVVEQSLNVRNEHEITGFCFTPQDGNSIMSSLSAAEWMLYPHSYKDKIKCLSKLFFNNI